MADGDNGNDIIVGTVLNDVISGGNGQDTIDGDAGNDQLFGDNGNDTLNGGADNDILDGGNGTDTLDGGTGDDELSGGNGDDTLIGGAGDDLLNGGNGKDTAVFSGLLSNYLATSLPDGSIRIRDLTGADGIDIVTDVSYFRFSDVTVGREQLLQASSETADYSFTTLGVTVDLNAGTATGPEIGTDILVGIRNVIGGSGDDVILGDAQNNLLFGGAGNDLLGGGPGSDLLDGGAGADRASFAMAPSAISVALAAGTVTVGTSTDTLRSIEFVRGGNFADTYDATGFGPASTNAGSLGTRNEFEGLGGNDLIIGNGNTRVSYANALAGVNVNLGTGTAFSIAPGDLAGIGIDTIMGGVNAARGSEFNDELRGTAGNDTLEGLAGDDLLGGGSGNDTLDGGMGFDTALYGIAAAAVTVDLAAGTAIGAASGTDTLLNIEAVTGSAFNDVLLGHGGVNTLIGNDGNDVLRGRGGNNSLDGGNGIDRAVFSGNRSAYTFAPGQVVGPDGTDSTLSVELLQFDDSFMLGYAGVPIDLSNYVFPNGNDIFGRGISDLLTLGLNANGRLIDLGNGIDTLTLQTFGTPSYSLNLVSVENLVSTGGIDTVTLQNVANAPLPDGMTIDLGIGFDALFLAEGDNVVTVRNVEEITAPGSGNDTVFFTPEAGVVNQSIVLGNGHNTLWLMGDEETFTFSVSGGNDLTVIGQTSPATGGNETVNVLNQQSGTVFNLAAGANDSLSLANLDPGFFNNVTVMGVEYVFGASTTHDTINIVGEIGFTEVTGGFGADMISASNAFDTFRFTSLQDSYSNAAERDVIIGFDANEDRFVFDGMQGSFVSGSIDFIGTGAFSGGGTTSEARLVDNGSGNQILEIDADGDGFITGNDMTIELQNLVNPLNDNSFLIV